MVNKYKLLNAIHLILLSISIIALIVNHFVKNTYWLLGIPLWIALITYIISMIIIFINHVGYAHLKTDNPIKTIKFSQEYYNKIGYSLFTGGIITLVTTPSKMISYGLIVIGFTCMIISVINQRRLEKFEEFKK